MKEEVKNKVVSPADYDKRAWLEKTKALLKEVNAMDGALNENLGVYDPHYLTAVGYLELRNILYRDSALLKIIRAYNATIQLLEDKAKNKQAA